MSNVIRCQYCREVYDLDGAGWCPACGNFPTVHQRPLDWLSVIVWTTIMVLVLLFWGWAGWIALNFYWSLFI